MNRLVCANCIYDKGESEPSSTPPARNNAQAQQKIDCSGKVVVERVDPVPCPASLSSDLARAETAFGDCKNKNGEEW